MPRAATKQDLIQSANEQFEKLLQLIDSVPEDMAFNLSTDFLEKQKEAHWPRDKNLRDVLMHL